MVEYVKNGAIVGAMVVLINFLSEKFLKRSWL